MVSVIIVDDSEVNRKLLKNILESAGYEVVGDASNGKEGLDIFKEKMPDIVTLDVSMPEMDGIEALKHMKKHNPKAKVIILSAASEKEKRDEAVLCGADEFIAKPYQKADILDALKRCAET